MKSKQLPANMRLQLLSVLLLSLFASSVQGNQVSNSGNKFYLAFFPNVAGPPITYLIFVAAADDEMVTFSITAPGRGYYTTATVGPGQVKSYTFDESYTLSSASDRTKAIIITVEKSKRLVVYGANERVASTDTFLALPPLALSSYKYIAVGYIPLRGFQSQIAIVATEDATNLLITPTQSTFIGTKSTSAGTTATVTLNRAETLLLQAPSDLTGTIVVSNKAISLFSGDQCANVPPQFGSCDLIVEQIPPVETWGTAFATAPILTRKQYDKFRLLSGGRNNRVNINCTLASGSRGLTQSFTLATEGSYQDFDVPSTQFCWIQGSAKMLLVQFTVGQTVDGVLTDPFMAIVPPYDQYSSSYTAVTVPPATQTYKHYLNIFIRSFSYQPDEILLNGTAINMYNGTQFVPIKQYDRIQVYAAQIPLPDGVFTLKHSGNPELAQIGIIVYGLGAASSYGYPGGLTFSRGTGTSGAENLTNVIGLVLTKKSERRVTVEWFQPVTDGRIEYYRVNVYERLKRVLLIRNFTTTDTSMDIDGLQPGTNYLVTVKTVVEGGEVVPEVTVDVSTVKSNINCSFGELSKSKDTLETFSIIQNSKLISPLMATPESLNTFKPTTFLCYKVFPVIHSFVNLFSSSCLSINAQYVFRVGQFYISSIGIVIGGSNGQCTHVTVVGSSKDEECQVTVNRVPISSSNSSYSTGSFVIEGSTVSPKVSMITVSSRVDDSAYAIAKVKCTWTPFLEMTVLHLYIPNSLSIANSHGLLGQLWNVPATVISPECEDFILFSSLPLYKVLLPDSRTIPVIHHTRQWDGDGSCLHASFQGPSVIEGTPADYTLSNLLATEYKYSRFSTMMCVDGTT